MRRRPTGRLRPPAAGAARPGAAPAARLPAQLDSFVGRRQELAQLRRLLSHCRLLTLTGPAGCGKTRLALQLGAAAREDHPDGAWMVELASLTDPGLLAHAVASTLGIGQRSPQGLVETIGQELVGRQALLVLDNCEHLVGACAAFVDDLLRTTPLTVLATSREVLDVAGETTYRVPPLSLPPADRPATSALAGSDAVHLFLERARSSSPDFQLTPENGPAIAQLCERLDGMPLAIELAARLVGIMPVEEILRRQSARLDLLVGRRTASDRHRSLRAAIEWSYELLDADERAVFRRLSVFAGGFDLEGAAAVCAGDDVRPESIVGLVFGLAAKSLVTQLSGSGDSSRLRQLESIRLFALERLDESGELEATRDRFADRLTGLAERFLGSHLDDSMARLLDAEHDNLLQAMEWMQARGDDRHALVAAALARQWRRIGHFAEGRRLLNAVLADPRVPPAHRSAVLHQAIGFAYWQGDLPGALALAQEEMEIERRLGRPLPLVRALEDVAMVTAEVGDHTAALARCRESLDLARQLGLPAQAARSANNLATMLLHAGRVEEAETVLEAEDVLPTFRSEYEPAAVSIVLCTAGEIALMGGDLDRSQARFRECLETSSLDLVVVSRAVGGLAIIAGRRGRHERALRLIAAAAAMRDAVQAGSEPWWEPKIAAAEAAARAALSPAAARAAAAAGRRGRRAAARSRAAARAAAVAGRRLSRAEAIELALETEPQGRSRTPAAGAQLTNREREVALLVAQGLTNPQVGLRLGISDRTVEAHIEHARQKLGLGSRTELAVWAAAGAETERPEDGSG